MSPDTHEKPDIESTEATSQQDKTVKRAAAQRSNTILLGVTLALVLILTGRALYKSGVNHEKGRVSLLALDQESVTLPEVLASRGLPLDELHQDIVGSHLDKARVYVGLYAKGRRGGEAWGEGKGLKEALVSAYDAAQQANRKDTPPTHAMVVVATNRRSINEKSLGKSFSNVHRGVLGAFVESKEHSYRVSPTQCLAANHSVEDELKNHARREKLDYDQWLANAEVYSVTSRQFYVPLIGEGKAIETLRGNVLVPPNQVNLAAVQNFEKLLTEWMFGNLAPDGRLTYLYYPSTGRESQANNMIRQWMGSVAMGRAAKIHQDERAAELSLRNIKYNLEQFYRTDGDLGFIEYENEAKLGAAALALISIIESPQRTELAEQERGLINTTKHLWLPNGRFNTFLKPEGRNDDNHNFYPGETLLAWSFLYAEKQDPDLLDKSMKSFVYYKQWHLQNRNPAFIPWHTQAYFQLYERTHSTALRDWIFEMNDWLIDVMQQNSRVGYDDTIGQFYDPTSKRYGVPHASSTGVYLEGLIDAFCLAREVGDQTHQEKYRKAILLGLRSGIQLQFQDEIDMFYVENQNRLRGGIRTTVYDNEVRVDNVQHILMGVQKILREFKADDYHL